MDFLVDGARIVMNRIGIEGISAVALVTALGVALHVHKVAAIGSTVASAGSTAAHDAKLLLVVGGVLLALGVLSVDAARLQDLLEAAMRFDWSGLFGRVVP